MNELSQIMIAAGALLIAADIVFYIWLIFFRHSVLTRQTKANAGFSLLFATSLVFVLGLYVLIYSIHFLSIYMGIMLLTGSIISSAALFGFYSWMCRMEAQGMEILEALVGIIEAGDPNLDGHSIHVRNLSMLLYDSLPGRLKKLANRDTLMYAALLLDVGKLGVPRSIINKCGKLEESEWELVRRHPEIGMKILAPLEGFGTIATWVKYHHERVDGSGYYKLSGKDIPFASRLIAVADTFSAITMAKNYKAALSYEDALSELRLAAGTQLDAELVDYFCSIPLHRIETCMEGVRKTMERYKEENFR